MFEKPFQFDDVFEPEVKGDKSELLDAIRKTGVLANKCLSNEDFQAYRKQFEKAQSLIISSMITYTHDFFLEPKAGMDVYGANMARFVTKLNDLRILLGQVEIDIKKAERVKDA
jgi:hypothetical protein